MVQGMMPARLVASVAAYVIGRRQTKGVSLVNSSASPAGSSMALWLKGVGARFLIEIMRVRVAPGLPISLRDRLNGRTAGFDPADLGSNPSPSTNLVQVSGVNG